MSPRHDEQVLDDEPQCQGANTLTLHEKTRLATQAKTMTETLLEATDLLGGMQWCLVHDKHDKHNISLFRAQCQLQSSPSAKPSSSSLPCNVHAVLKFQAEIDEVAEAMLTPTTEQFKKMMTLLSSDFVDGTVLHAIVDPTDLTPYRAVTIKWAAFKSATPFGKDHDCIFLEYVDMLEDDQGQKVAFRVMQSIEMPSHAEFAPSSKYARDVLPLMGFMYHTTCNDGELRLTYTCNFASDDDLPAWAANTAIQCHVEKAISGVLKYLEAFRAAKDEQDLVLPQQVLSMNEQNHCSICKKVFNVWRRRHNCLKCGQVICSNCSALRTAKVPDVGERLLRVCTACVLAARHSPKPSPSPPNEMKEMNNGCASPISTFYSTEDSDTQSDIMSLHYYPQQHVPRHPCDDLLDPVRSRLIEYKDFSEDTDISVVPKAEFPARSFSDGLVRRKGSLFQRRRRGSPADLAISLQAFRLHQLRMATCNNENQAPEDNEPSDDDDESGRSANSFASSFSSCSSTASASSCSQMHGSTCSHVHESLVPLQAKVLSMEPSPHRRYRSEHGNNHNQNPSRAMLNEAMARHQSIMEATAVANTLAQHARKLSHHRVVALQREHQQLLDICGANNQDDDHHDAFGHLTIQRMRRPLRQVSDGVVRYARDPNA